MSAWADTPTLQGQHVTLRPLVREDRDALLEASSDGRLWELFYTIAPGPDTMDAWLARAFNEKDYGRALPFAILDKSGKLIGSTRFMRMSEPSKRLEIGATFYAASVQRSGVNTESKLLLLTHAFEVMGVNVVEIRTDWLNKRSQAAIERLGAKRDGVLRSHVITAGRVRDTVVYSILAQEWQGVKMNLQHMLARAEKGLKR